MDMTSTHKNLHFTESYWLFLCHTFNTQFWRIIFSCYAIYKIYSIKKTILREPLQTFSRELELREKCVQYRPFPWMLHWLGFEKNRVPTITRDDFYILFNPLYFCYDSLKLFSIVISNTIVSKVDHIFASPNLWPFDRSDTTNLFN